MPRFNFKLQRVLDIKERREKQLKEELAHLRRKYKEEEGVLEALEESYTMYLDRLREHQSKSILVEEVKWHQIYLSKLGEDISSQLQKLEDLLKRIDELTKELIEASKERRVLERLRERRLDEFKREVEYLEQETLDEIGTSQYIRGVGRRGW